MFSRTLTTFASAARFSVTSPSSVVLRSSLRTAPSRGFQSTTPRLEVSTVALPVRKPVGAFRGGILGFLMGSTIAGAGVYYYILEEYRVSNELLTEDIYALQNAVLRIESYVRTMEGSIKAQKN